MSAREELTQGPERSPRVSFSLRLAAPAEGPDELVKTLQSLLGPIRAAAGCLRCVLLEDVRQANELHLLVEWRSWEDFEHHVKTDPFRRVLQGLELSTEPPDLQIRTITGVRGMDLLQEILGCDDA